MKGILEMRKSIYHKKSSENHTTAAIFKQTSRDRSHYNLISPHEIMLGIQSNTRRLLCIHCIYMKHSLTLHLLPQKKKKVDKSNNLDLQLNLILKFRWLENEIIICIIYLWNSTLSCINKHRILKYLHIQFS